MFGKTKKTEITFVFEDSKISDFVKLVDLVGIPSIALGSFDEKKLAAKIAFDGPEKGRIFSVLFEENNVGEIQK